MHKALRCSIITERPMPFYWSTNAPEILDQALDYSDNFLYIYKKLFHLFQALLIHDHFLNL